jgi:hypothetical protein
LALFLIGALFLVVGLRYAKKPPLNIVGKINIDDPSLVTVAVQFTDSFTPDSDGKLDKMIPVDFSRLRVVINANGYEPRNFTTTLRAEDKKKQKLALADEVRFTKTNMPKPSPGEVAPTPPGLKLESLK